MAWAVWLAVPIGATSLAALWAWWRGVHARRALQLDTPESMRAHSDYLAALAIPARSAHRPPSNSIASGSVVVANHRPDETHSAAS
jgi:hypothetical protein